MNYSKFNLYFGDPHGHSNLSLCGVCVGRDLLSHDIYIHSSLVKEYLERKDVKPEDTVDEFYEYARDQAKLDFAALTDHDFSMTDEMWVLIRKKSSDWYSPGKFVTFSAYEWTSAAYGHRNVYFLTDDGPLIRCVEYGSKPSETKGINPRELWSRLRKTRVKAITIPHHPPITQFPVDWDYYDPEFDRVVEVASLWGVFEYYGNPFYCLTSDNLPRRFVFDALEMGYKLGFVGGSDSHDCRPGGRVGAVIKRNAPRNYRLNSLSKSFTLYFFRNPIRPYLTAVYAKDLTRESIFEAIKNRRTYALIGTRAKLEFTVDDHLIGEEIRVGDPNHRPTLRVSIEGEADLDRVEIVKNGRVVLRKLCKGKQVNLKYVDESEPTRLYNYYYIRVIQRDGSRAWSSPIWVIYKNLGKVKIKLDKRRRQLALMNIGRRELSNVKLAVLENYKIVIKKEPSIKLRRISRGAFFWLERKQVDLVILKARFKSDTPVNFRGSIKLYGHERYFVKTINFAIVKYGGDLFTDDYEGYVEWDVTPSSRLNKLDKAKVKGLDVVVHSSPFKQTYAIIEVFQDGEIDLEHTFIDNRQVSKVPFKVTIQELLPFTEHNINNLSPFSKSEIPITSKAKFLIIYPYEIDDFGPKAGLIDLRELQFK